MDVSLNKFFFSISNNLQILSYDIYREIKREFDVNSYKAIKRRYLEDVLDIVEKYRLTIALKEQIGILNNQVIWE